MFLFLSPLAHRLLPLFSLVAHRFSPPLEGVGEGHPELVEGLPDGTVGNRSLQPPLQTCGESGYCRDCSPNSPKRKAARSGYRAGCRIGLITLIARKTARSGTARVVPLA